MTVYTKQIWNNNDSNTPLSATRLNHIEDGLGALDTALAGLATVATTGSYTNLTNKPTLSLVSSSGSYNDLSDKPTLSVVAATGSYADLLNKPTFSQVATTGSYLNLTDRPTIPATPSDIGAAPAVHSHIANEISDASVIGRTVLTSLDAPAALSSLGGVPTTRTVAGKALSANITLVKADVGLGSVDNTSDATKNVLSATKFTTARTINGVSFDGSANITVADSTKVPTTRLVAGQALSADITAAALLSGLGLDLTTVPIAVQWTGTSWGTYDTNANRVRLFFSQNDANATAPTAYNLRDEWIGVGG